MACVAYLLSTSLKSMEALLESFEIALKFFLAHGPVAVDIIIPDLKRVGFLIGALIFVFVPFITRDGIVFIGIYRVPFFPADFPVLVRITCLEEFIRAAFLLLRLRENPRQLSEVSRI